MAEGGSAAERRGAVVLALAGAGLVLLAGGRSWATVQNLADEVLPSMGDLTVSGRHAAPALIPIALACAAGAIVLAFSGRLVRIVVAAGLAIGGVTIAEEAVRSVRDHDALAMQAFLDTFKFQGAAGQDAAGMFAGLSGDTTVEVSAWHWVAFAGALLIVAAAALTLLRGWAWPGPGQRFSRPAQRTGPSIDLTGTASRSTGVSAEIPPSPGTDPWGSPASGAGPDPSAAAAWDALSRGEDPTSHHRHHT